jgi:PKD repeat protein
MSSPDGNSASTSREVRVENVKANFTSVVNGTSISLTDTSAGFPTNWLWSIRDENGANQLFTDRNQSTEATLRLPGTYQVTLTSWNDWNKDSKTAAITI